MTEPFRILIIDDERIVCDRLKPILERLGFVVEAYTDSTEAIRQLTTVSFDVLVTDLKMPGVGGMDVLTYAHTHSPSTKVIVITGFATLDTAEEAQGRGAVAFLPKPFRMSQLRDLIVDLARQKANAPAPPEP